MFFAIQKANFVDIQSSRFQWYSFLFERTQSRLVSLLITFEYALWQIMIAYAFLEAREMFLNNVWTHSDLNHLIKTTHLPGASALIMLLVIMDNWDRNWLCSKFRKKILQNYLQIHILQGSNACAWSCTRPHKDMNTEWDYYLIRHNVVKYHHGNQIRYFHNWMPPDP